MTGLPITLTFTFDDMAQAERAIAAVRRAITDTPETASDTMGGLPVPAASVTAERTGRTAAYARTGSHGTPHGSGVTSGETASHSEMDGGAIAAVKGRARPASVVDAEPSPSFTILPLSKPLRPHCQNREVCAGVGLKHCHRCSKAAEAAQASEIAA